ncbi:MAG: antitoxin VapB family protein [Candidatus Aenigmarchaeota archaeon]|nr:antitoxin VapB family protein [Candidatus Aenigmarchaeota archaeon]
MPKLISLSENAYERLAAKKIEGESFSDVVSRLTGGTKNLTDFAGLLTEGEANIIEKKITDLRAASRKRANSNAKAMNL